MMGAERKSMVIGEEERKLTAFHEAGHALVALYCSKSDPIHKATIIPRGRALGMVMRLPLKDQLSLTRGKAKADLAVAMGGRVAEEMIFGYDMVTSGASSDIRMATNLARNMVTEWGMSDKIGPIFHSANQEEVFLGHSVSQQKNMSEDTANLIDSEVKSLVNEGYARAQEILKNNKDQLEILAAALLEHETLTGDEINDVLKGNKIIKEKNIINKTVKRSSVPLTVIDKPIQDEEIKETHKESGSKVKKSNKKPAKPKKGTAVEGA
jgi:cell division protease FtsH